MRPFRHRRGFVSIFTKLTLSGSAVIVALVLLIEASVYGLATRLQIEDSDRLNLELVETLGKSFDDMAISFKRAIDFITMNSEFQEVLEESAEGRQWGAYNVRLKRLLSDRELLINEMDGLYLYDAGGRLRTYIHKKNRPDLPVPSLAEIDLDRFLQTGMVTSHMQEGHLVFLRHIRGMKDLKSLGYLVAIYDEDFLRERVNSLVANKDRFVVVLDQYGEVAVHNYADREALDRMLESIDLDALGSSQIVDLPAMGRTLLAQYTSGHNGWRTVSAVAVGQVIRSSSVILRTVLALGALSILTGAGVQLLAARKIVGPVNHMVEVVRRADDGDYRGRMELNTGDELDILAAAFNQMLTATDNLVNQVLRDEIKYRDTQLEALQAQINPHLLHNTLECINWLAEFGRTGDIRRVTIAFSNLMKSLSSGPRMVTVAEELGYIEDFLVIYSILLEGKLVYHIEVGEIDSAVRIPRLALQPLVENAVVHGIKGSVLGGHIHVGVTADEDRLLVSIQDDGAGMAPGAVERINRYARGDGEEAEGFGIGIRNVIDRLRLVYGGRAGLTVTSSDSWGTVVDIHIPIEEP